MERLPLVVSSDGAGNTGAGMMMDVRDPDVEAQELLSAFPLFEPLLALLLTPCRTVRLLNHSGAARRGDDVLTTQPD